MRCPHCWGEQWPKCDHSGEANSAQLSLSPAIAQREHDFYFFIYFWMGGVVFCLHPLAFLGGECLRGYKGGKKESQELTGTSSLPTARGPSQSASPSSLGE